MQNSVMIRDARKEDLADIVSIYNSTIPGRMVTADTEPVTVQDRLPWFEAHQEDQRRPLWVAEIDGTLCGWLSLSNFYGRPAYQSTVEISIYLDERFRGMGIGSGFVRYALEHCKALGINTVLAFIFGQNTPSLHLFERFGFERWGTCPRVAVLDGIERDLVIMGHRVTD
ncbi:GNAT family N-acetyltransferase [Sporolactobacillus kofuensis]|uniref:GNAT family N-acetyltransferase n=1 Tax=Sporolactobacillus kofuensis TaxID=269672 RepID=A0ABW1WF93_9BACL|nr:GNAT family N-acetyltransferase [Sporolactobacillus kofuensis]MCO7175337.1 GNAT family N-acetyltransferase [Sporolactobacillus kofuensis]